MAPHPQEKEKSTTSKKDDPYHLRLPRPNPALPRRSCSTENFLTLSSNHKAGSKENSLTSSRRLDTTPKIDEYEDTSDEEDNETRKRRFIPLFSFVAETLLPTVKGAYKVRAYKQTIRHKDSEIICILWGDVRGKKNVPCRVHDQCFTSEVLGSLKCDCREQLDWAMDYLKDTKQNKKGCGIIIYMPQEGRGIGLANKIKAYSMQELGYDTVDANRVLGFKDDLREYSSVPLLLNDLGVVSIRLMSNNPRKSELLKSLGVTITSRIPVLIPPNPHSDLYIHTKKARMGHMS
jgi:GTP cyclohydrolase II